MEAQIVIDLATATPPFEQVRTQISALIAVGQLAPGARLPTVRSLAADLGVAAGTVARAYKELEVAGIVITNRRQGTVVAARESPDWAHVQEGPSASLQAAGPARDMRQMGVAGQAPVTNALAVMAAIEHLIGEGEKAGLDGKTLIILLQGRLNQRGQ